ncbi:ATP-binding protein [Dactylosporangium sucinum]|uniref:ATP-binding protein n=1 Tax=Dactylosporangium sucinum TaxID=1424081 RepID=UPI001E28FB24|nr:ATP-binding protein [Dactylosporangium sucinum]
MLRCEFSAGTMRSLRKQLRRRALDCGLSGRVLDDFVVAVNEIATNAVVHGGGSGTLSLSTGDGQLICEISDNGAGLPLAAPDGDGGGDLVAEAGRGLHLARALAGPITVSRGAGPAVVRLVADLPAPG